MEYHGKSPCDSRFGQISNMLKNYNNDENNPRILCTDDVIEAITSERFQMGVTPGRRSRGSWGQANKTSST